jgi:hypothetical protein
MNYPCSSLPSQCSRHKKYHENALNHNFPPPFSSKCLVTTLATETLQQISSYLDIVSAASFSFSCKTIGKAVGTAPWEKLSDCVFVGRGKGGKRTVKGKRKGDLDAWIVFLKLLARDERGLMCCERCGILHWLNLEKFDDCYLKKEEEVGTSKRGISLCEGAYVLEPSLVPLATSGRICPELLSCHGENYFEIEVDKSMDDAEKSEESGFMPISDLLTPHQFTNPKRPPGVDYCWSHANEIRPIGGGLITRFNRLLCRLKEIRTTVQGHEWHFYFPMTLLCFLPRSRPFWVKTHPRIVDGEAKEVGTRRVGYWKKWRMKGVVEEDAIIEGGTNNAVEGIETEEDPTDGLESEDPTGWKGYYLDLESPRHVSFTETGEVVAQFRKNDVFYLYGSKNEARISWYDTPKNGERLAWCQAKKEKWNEQ